MTKKRKDEDLVREFEAKKNGWVKPPWWDAWQAKKFGPNSFGPKAQRPHTADRKLTEEEKYLKLHKDEA